MLKFVKLVTQGYSGVVVVLAAEYETAVNALNGQATASKALATTQT